MGHGIEENSDSSVVVTKSSLGKLGGETWSEGSSELSSVVVKSVGN